MTPDESALLKEEMDLMNQAGERLRQSYDLCQKIGVKRRYLEDELEHIEAFTSRFARTADLLIQRMFRLIDELDLEPSGTVRDRINRAEKKELIADAYEFVDIRNMRNAIVHEYKADAPEKIYPEVWKKTPALFDSIVRVNRYSRQYTEGGQSDECPMTGGENFNRR